MITYQKEFDAIRPFYDNEINDAVNRILNEPGFIKTICYFFPEVPVSVLKEKLSGLTSVTDFQMNFIIRLIVRIINQSTSGLTYSGLENLDPGKNYVYLSNHRDIVLDSAFLNYVLIQNNFQSTEIAIGSNLLILPWITDLVRMNKTFIVQRNVPVKEQYRYSNILSSYIRYSVTSNNRSIWIAQREGRTKNGNDKTQLSLLKMLNISGEANAIENLSELNVVPVSISYEFEPLDREKVIETYSKKHIENFKKTRLDDLLSMSKGLTSQKGQVHFHFGKPITESIQKFSSIRNKNEQLEQIAGVIDNCIYKGYQLQPINYIAAHLLFNSNDYNNYFTSDDLEKYTEYFNNQLKNTNGEEIELRKMLLGIYANPVVNKNNAV